MGGCQNLSQEPIQPAPLTVSVTDAKEFYEATKGRSKVASKYQFLWDLVEVKKLGDVPVVMVPVENIGGGNTLIQNQNNRLSSSRIGSESVIFYHNAAGELTASLLSMDETDPVGMPSNKVYFLDWIDSSLQSVWTLKDGSLIQTDRAVNSPNAKVAECTLDFYMKVCTGAGRVGGADINPTGLPDPGEGCHWEYIGSASCGGGDGGGTPTEPVPNDPFPLPTTKPIVLGGGGTSAGGGVYSFSTQPTSVVLNLMNAVAPYGIQFTSTEIGALNTLPFNAINRIQSFLLDKKTKATWFYEQMINAYTGKVYTLDEQNILKSRGDSFYRVYFLAYAANAYGATRSTARKFNESASDCGTCKANAYKHAIFRIFDAETFGRDIAEQLGKAHEPKVVPKLPETIMDEKNNASGLSIFDTYGYTYRETYFWEVTLLNAINSGSLCFLLNGSEVQSNVYDPESN